MTSENASLSQRMFDASVRVEEMYWIGGNCEPCDGLRDFIEDDLQGCADLLNEFPWLKAAAGEADSLLAEDILSDFAFHNVDGFIAQLMTPIPTKFLGEKGSYEFSWGRCRLKWVFARSLEDLTDQAESWKAGVLEEHWQKHLKAKSLPAEDSARG